MKTDTIPEAKDRLKTLVLLSLEEHSALVVVVSGPPHPVWVLWIT